jgi:hypothetical protein
MWFWYPKQMMHLALQISFPPHKSYQQFGQNNHQNSSWPPSSEATGPSINLSKCFHEKRCIQENFIYVLSVIKALHKAKRPSFFIKLDISKSFDSVSWVFLLEILQALGFGQRWRDWIATLLATSSSKILLVFKKTIKARERFTTRRSVIIDVFYFGHWPPSSIDRVGST